MFAACTLLLAAALDRACGEPPNAWHPVAWFGRAMAPVGQWLLVLPSRAALPLGALAWVLAVGSAALLGWVVQLELLRWVADGRWWLALPVAAVALKPSLCWRMLHDEVAAVETALSESTEAGRAQVARLCSRNVEQLEPTAVREAAIETLAENLNDSWVAPLFWFVLAGLPGAWAFRAANTLDAMWGYRGQWEWAGKWAAHADDVLAWLPARITAALLWRPGVRLRALAREARLTPSPNGGWPMAAMALRLGVQLGKPTVYLLNATGHAADEQTLRRALVAAHQAAVAACVLAVSALVLQAWIQHPGWLAATWN